MTPVERLALRARFSVAQAARVGWYASQSLAATRLASKVGRTLPPVPKPTIAAPAGVPPRAVLLREVRALLARDLANVEAGLYPMPHDEPEGIAGLFEQRARYLRDVPEIVRRRAEGAHQEVDRSEGKRPRYYMQNFHFQTDGWMSEESARLYETQVETLFFGAAAAMRRQALVPVAERAAEVDQRTLRLLDVASGSGAFLRDLATAFPRLPVIASDLSEPYVELARGRLNPAARGGAVVAPAERLPFADGSFDILTNIYLFHELPPKVRPLVAAEFARVLKPGGRAVVVDSLQSGDTPLLDGLLELFPQMFHEPYYRSYLTTDFDQLFAAAGLEVEASWSAFVSKVFVLRRV
ncbi:class I SAM-dependent methyltransferase [Acuticoccus sp. MNP-M23]|uniref:class I SAM-dependent methyltransferase n=1 Tax=Acuticoccus sp. MNP-M23 TaxID=3072793 RepID=UPI0028161979|nr:class I SAM-dependent methyltransferase [Acuticoccus sp. MNP-M23]WMS43321.1 class I SAM-dependent methyltransferase [Acuticoccus sp. MNP-M23]